MTSASPLPSATASAPALMPAATAPTLAFLAAACFRSPAALSWLPRTHPSLYPEGLVAFASGPFVAVYDPAACVIVATLRGHTKAVHAACWLQQPLGHEADGDGEQLTLVSAGVDKTLRVWTFSPRTRDYRCVAVLAGHEDSVSAVVARRVRTAEASAIVIASTSSDLTARVWMRRDDAAVAADDAAGGFECVQIIPSGRHKIMHCLDLIEVPLTSSAAVATPSASVSASSPSPSSYSSLPRSILLLSIAGVDRRVHVYLSSTCSAGAGAVSIDFAPAVSLEGHEGWIRALSFAVLDRDPAGADCEALATVLLASASQDRHVRLWKFVLSAEGSPSPSPSDVPHATSLGSRGHIVTYRGLSLAITLDSVLHAHDNWVTCARWAPRRGNTQPLELLTSSTDKAVLLWRPTTRRGPDGGVWNADVRVGEMGGHSLGFFGASLSPKGDAILAHAYSGSLALWREEEAQPTSPSPSSSGGGLRRWLPSLTVSGHSGSVEDLSWDARGDYLLSLGGAMDQTTRLWGEWNGASTAPGRGVRVPPIAPAVAAADSAASASAAAASSSPAPLRHSWHELSRPQIHGYDLRCVTPLYDPANLRPHSFASGAEEKVLRVFWAPLPFLDSIRQIAGVDTVEAVRAARPLRAEVVQPPRLEGGGGGGGEEDEGEEESKQSPPPAAAASSVPKGADAEQIAFLESSTSSRALRANLPELGLSNKALLEGDSAHTLRGMQHSSAIVSRGQDLSAHAPPTEDYLVSQTLWPEVEKLYGHGFELLSVCCNYAGTMLASSGIAKKQQHAAVRIWDVATWTELMQLESHRSSVIQMAFSPDSRFLLSVSKDRHVSLFEFGVNAAGKPSVLSTTKHKAHARIIWGCSWAPIEGQYYFATASRDKTVKCFRVSDAAGAPAIVEDATLPAFSCAVTAVAFAPLAPRVSSQDSLFPVPAAPAPLTLAVGLEDGRIELWQSNAPFTPAGAKLQWRLLYALPINVCHSGTVRRLSWRWRAAPSSSAPSELQLASCSEDQSVRIFAIPATNLLA